MHAFAKTSALAAALALLTAACQSPPPAQVTLASAAITASPRTISVTGAAEVLTAPDELIVSVGVESFAVEAEAAKGQNDRVMKELLAAAASLDVSDTVTRTSDFTMTPHYEGPYESHRLTGYDVKKTLTVTVNDAARAEKLLAELFKHGANRLDGVTPSSTKAMAQRKEVRTMAVSEARAKAESMAAALGQKIGRPTKMSESAEPAFRTISSNAVFDNATRAAVHDAMAPGKLRIAASVEITFELVD